MSLIKAVSTAHSFDHLIGGIQEPFRNRQTECLSGLEIDVQLDFSGLLHRQVGGFVAFENPAGIDASEAVCLSNVRSVAQQTSGHSELAIRGNRWHDVTNRQRGEPFAPARK